MIESIIISIEITTGWRYIGFMSDEMKRQTQDAVRATGLPLLEIARRTGVSQPQLYHFMNNRRTLTLPAIEKLCKALGLELRPSKQPKSKRKP